MAVEVAELLAVCRRRNKLILPAGLKMRERFYIRVLAGCASRYYIATPYDFMNIEEAMGDERLSEQEEQELVEVNTNYLNLNNTSIKGIQMAVRRDKMVVAVYPRATRERNGLLQRAPEMMESYFRRHDEFIVPVMSTGVYDFLPPGEFPKIWRVKGIEIDFRVGRPFPAEQLWTPQTQEVLKELGATRIDLVMARIARLNWDKVDPRFVELYRQIDKRLPMPS
ncbi:hypothetical protein HYS93_02170 [Candidatus Daviesbacteria bacterium]|nr:hypothetical protein [Candidatus Daviesbacteria bacterium]